MYTLKRWRQNLGILDLNILSIYPSIYLSSICPSIYLSISCPHPVTLIWTECGGNVVKHKSIFLPSSSSVYIFLISVNPALLLEGRLCSNHWFEYIYSGIEYTLKDCVCLNCCIFFVLMSVFCLLQFVENRRNRLIGDEDVILNSIVSIYQGEERRNSSL